MPQRFFSKFKRPDEPTRSRITERDLDIIETILNFRFSPAAELIRLVGGNEDVTHRRLRLLWEKGLINRFAFIRTHSQLHYYLDNKEALDLLLTHKRLDIPHRQMLEEIRNNREKDYATAAHRGSEGQLMFLRHELLLSRLHFMLEMAARKSTGALELEAWVQGAQLTGHKLELPSIRSSRRGNEYLWEEHDRETERLPVEPDALFTLRFADRPSEQQLVHFFYEADRGTMNSTDLMKKLRAYYHFIKKQQRHKEAFGIHPIRAVLIETTDEARGQKLMQLVGHPLVVGPAKRSALFWFTISSLFTEAGESKSPAPYLIAPEMILDPIWALPSRTMLALSDIENSPTATSFTP